jgi:hypothetical protein
MVLSDVGRKSSRCGAAMEVMQRNTPTSSGAGRVNLAGQNHVCAFFNTMDEEHRVLRSFYKGDFDRG